MLVLLFSLYGSVADYNKPSSVEEGGTRSLTEGECVYNITSTCSIKTQAPSVSHSLASSLSEGAFCVVSLRSMLTLRSRISSR